MIIIDILKALGAIETSAQNLGDNMGLARITNARGRFRQPNLGKAELKKKQVFIEGMKNIEKHAKNDGHLLPCPGSSPVWNIQSVEMTDMIMAGLKIALRQSTENTVLKRMEDYLVSSVNESVFISTAVYDIKKMVAELQKEIKIQKESEAQETDEILNEISNLRKNLTGMLAKIRRMRNAATRA